MATKNTEFLPDYDQEHAGAYLSWVLEARGIKKVDFARRCGPTSKTISEIIAGKAPISPETALQFERVLGDSAGYWLQLDARFQLQQARAKERIKSVSAAAMAWAREFPIAEMVKAKFLPSKPKEADLVDTMLRFFGVSSINAFREFWEVRVSPARFKQHNHHEIDQYAVAAWLRQGEILADQIDTAPYDEGNFRVQLDEIRALTRRPWQAIEYELVDLCAKAGVALALVPSLKNTGLRGAAFWAHKDKAVIVLSDRGKYEERFWFAFFHEAAHILLHSKKSIFIDQDKTGTEDRDIEREADAYSAEFLVPENAISSFREMYGEYANDLEQEELEDFAEEIGISPGLLLERLQHEDLIVRNSAHNKTLKRKAQFDCE